MMWDGENIKQMVEFKTDEGPLRCDPKTTSNLSFLSLFNDLHERISSTKSV